MKFGDCIRQNQMIAVATPGALIRACMLVLVLGAALLVCGTASAAELHVGSGQTFSTIQSAVDAASEGDTIIVHAGSYTENVNINKRLTLQGEGADVVTVTTASIAYTIATRTTTPATGCTTTRGEDFTYGW